VIIFWANARTFVFEEFFFAMPASAISAALPCAALSANDLSVEESVEVARLGRAVEATN